MTETYIARVGMGSGRVYLYHDTYENGVKVENHVATFQDWSEFFSVACSPVTFTRNPFDGIRNLYVQAMR